MNQYQGSLVLATGVAMVYADIDPPERSGYVNEITHIELLADEDSGVNYTEFMWLASVKVPARISFSEANLYLPDIIARGMAHSALFASTEDVRPIQVNKEELLGDLFLFGI